MMTLRYLALAAVLVSACNGQGATAPTATSSPDAGTPQSACQQLAKKCHAHDGEGPLPHECHHLGHAAPSEDACRARLDECLAACGGSGS